MNGKCVAEVVSSYSKAADLQRLILGACERAGKQGNADANATKCRKRNAGMGTYARHVAHVKHPGERVPKLAGSG